MGKITWRQVRLFVNTIPETFLDREVMWWGEERGGVVTAIRNLEEDHVQTEEGIEPRSVIEPDNLDESAMIYEKGLPILETD